MNGCRCAASISWVVLMFGVVGTTTGSELVLGGPKNDRGVTVRTTANGGFIVVGVTESRGSGGEDVYLIRLDAEAEVLWETAFGGSGDDDGWSVLETAAGGFVVAGFSNSTAAGGFDCFLTATDGKGARQWSRNYGGTEDDRCWSVAATADGGCAITGHTTRDSAGGLDLFFARVDDKGKVVDGPPAGD